MEEKVGSNNAERNVRGDVCSAIGSAVDRLEIEFIPLGDAFGCLIRGVAHKGGGRRSFSVSESSLKTLNLKDYEGQLKIITATLLHKILKTNTWVHTKSPEDQINEEHYVNKTLLRTPDKNALLAVINKNALLAVINYLQTEITIKDTELANANAKVGLLKKEKG